MDGLEVQEQRLAEGWLRGPGGQADPETSLHPLASKLLVPE